MSHATKRRSESASDPVRVLGRGLRAQRGVHLTLRAVREAAGRTQVEVREASGIDQADISRLEGRESLDDSQVSTLQRYIAALGGPRKKRRTPSHQAARSTSAAPTVTVSAWSLGGCTPIQVSTHTPATETMARPLNRRAPRLKGPSLVQVRPSAK